MTGKRTGHAECTVRAGRVAQPRRTARVRAIAHAARAIVAASVGLGLLLGGVASELVASPAAAATPDLTMVAAARYDVQPDKHRVHLTVSLSATNDRTDTVIRRYYVDHAFLAVLPGTSAFKVVAVGSKAKPTVRATSKTKSQTLLRIDFGTKLGSGKTMQLTLTFDLVDPGGAATRQVRVGDTLATFPVWAFGSAGVSSGTVTVAFPADYQVVVRGGPLSGPKTGTGGSQVYTSGSLAKPLTFVAYVVADRPGGYLETPLSLTVGGSPLSVVVRAWKDDAAFGRRTSALVSNSLPALGTLIGIPVPGSGTALAVQEAITRAAGGYAALYDVAGSRIDVAYDAAPGLIIREAAHAWFNGALVADGWTAQGFAAYYANTVAAKLKVPVPAEPLTKTVLAAKIPLNGWDGSGRPDAAVDAYVKAASLQLASLIVKRAGSTGMAAVWRAAAAGEQADLPVAGDTAAAQPPLPPPGSSGGATGPDWRTLLDLLETRTTATYTDLWCEWVVRPDETALLTARTAARSSYTTALAEADGWELPATVRTALDAWQFSAASDLITQVRAVFASRPALEAAAGAADLILPPTAKVRFEASGPAAAASEMAAERTAIVRISADGAARQAAADPVEAIGLIGQQPEIALAAARTAFAAGDLPSAVASADAARLAWDGARDLGRGRLAVAAAALAMFGVAVLLLTHRRDRRSSPGTAPIRSMPRMKDPGPRLSLPAMSGGGPHLGGRPTPHGSVASAPTSRTPVPTSQTATPLRTSAPTTTSALTAKSAPPGTAAPAPGLTMESPLPVKLPRTVVVPGRRPRAAPPPPRGLAALLARRAPGPPATPARPPMAHRIVGPGAPAGPTPSDPRYSHSEALPRYGTLAASLPGERDPATGRSVAMTRKTESASPSQPGEAAVDTAPGDDR